ncbi:putative ankyrin repeat protein, partial [Lactarius hengduanensis]
SQDPDEHDGRKTPLFHASASGSLKVVRVLIEHGADVNAPHTTGFGPLHIASTKGNLEILRLLVAGG